MDWAANAPDVQSITKAIILSNFIRGLLFSKSRA
jgi:hypothetical protein